MLSWWVRKQAKLRKEALEGRRRREKKHRGGRLGRKTGRIAKGRDGRRGLEEESMSDEFDAGQN